MSGWTIFTEINNKVEGLHQILGKSFVNGTDVHDTHHVWGALISGGLAISLGVFAKKAINKSENPVIPSEKFNARNIMELFIEAFYNMAKDIIGPNAKKFFPWVATFALFIFFSNLLSLIPGFLPPTDNLNTTLALGAFSFILYNWYGIKEQGAATHFKHLLGPMPALAPLMLPIELISHIARPLSLALRLMGNIAGDHLVLGLFLSIFAFLLPLPIMFLGAIVILVQTLVFTILTIVYIGMAVEHDSH